VNVKLMEGVLSDEQKKTLMKNLVDAVVKVYGPPMRLFMHVVLEEIKTGDWIAGGGVVTSERVGLISPNVRRGRSGAGKQKATNSRRTARRQR
jgi:phenylpyruvate tautomerase PptA (4-oxalocrotonate tautomerase family)